MAATTRRTRACREERSLSPGARAPRGGANAGGTHRRAIPGGRTGRGRARARPRHGSAIAPAIGTLTAAPAPTAAPAAPAGAQGPGSLQVDGLRPRRPERQDVGGAGMSAPRRRRRRRRRRPPPPHAPPTPRPARAPCDPPAGGAGLRSPGTAARPCAPLPGSRRRGRPRAAAAGRRVPSEFVVRSAPVAPRPAGPPARPARAGPATCRAPAPRRGAARRGAARRAARPLSLNFDLPHGSGHCRCRRGRRNPTLAAPSDPT
jgi:hypothetical protein